MNVQEQPIHIAGDGFDMLGILTLPAPGMPMRRIGVVVVVGGAQYRVGSHRQFVRLARRLAAAGHPVLRFDLPGMGDSPGEPVPFENTAPTLQPPWRRCCAPRPCGTPCSGACATGPLPACCTCRQRRIHA